MKFLTNGFAYSLIFQFLLGFSGLAFSQSISLTIQDAQREFWYLLSVGRKTEAQTLLAAFIPQLEPKDANKISLHLLQTGYRELVSDVSQIVLSNSNSTVEEKAVAIRLRSASKEQKFRVSWTPLVKKNPSFEPSDGIYQFFNIPIAYQGNESNIEVGQQLNATYEFGQQNSPWILELALTDFPKQFSDSQVFAMQKHIQTSLIGSQIIGRVQKGFTETNSQSRYGVSWLVPIKTRFTQFQQDFTYSKIEHSRTKEFNGDVISSTTIWSPSGSLIDQIGASFEMSNLKSEFDSYSSVGVFGQTSNLPWQLSANLAIHHRLYESIDPFFAKQREDLEYQTQISKLFVVNQMILIPSMTFNLLDSNITFHQRDSVAVEVEFIF